MHIWYLNHYAKPSSFGTPGRSLYLARALMNMGHEPLIVAASDHHTRIKPAPVEDINHVTAYEGVSYYHVPTRPYTGNGIYRVLNMLDYSREVEHLAGKVRSGELPKPDILIPSCVHIFAYPAAKKLARLCGAKVIFEVRDIWPLSLVELAGVPPWHPLILWMSHIEKMAYREADAGVSLVPDAVEYMSKKGLLPDRYHYIPNGVDLEEWNPPFEPLPEEHQAVFDKCRESGKMIVVYAGAHGPPNALDQILDLKKVLKSREAPYHFILIGSGVDKNKLVDRQHHDDIDFVSFLPRIPKKAIISAILQADVCFMSLKNSPVFRFGISPNKFGDYLIAGRPILYAVKASNNPVEDSGSGISIEPYNVMQLDDALRTFVTMTELERKEMGRRGKSYALENLEWSILGKRYGTLCEHLAGPIR